MLEKDMIVIVDVSIWELSKHDENYGKYQLAFSILNGGSITFGPQFKVKKEAEEFLSKIKKQQLFGFDEGYAFMKILIEKMRLKIK